MKAVDADMGRSGFALVRIQHESSPPQPRPLNHAS